MLVNWKGDGMNIIPPIDPDEKDAAKSALVKAVKLYPGWNEVPDNLWKFCKLHLKDQIEKGSIEEISVKRKGEDGIEVYEGVAFTDYAVKNRNKAIEMIENCFDIDCLKNWGKNSQYDEIRIAVKNQVEACENGGPKE